MTKRPVYLKWYHGTDAVFETFDTSGLGTHFGTPSQALNAPGGGARVLEVTLCVNNPLLLDDLYSWNSWDLTGTIEDMFGIELDDLRHRIVFAQGDNVAETGFLEELKSHIQAQGFDGIAYDNSMEGLGYSIIAFEPDQITIVAARERAEHRALFNL